MIVVADIEMPDHDPRILILALLTGMRYGIKRLVLGGDIIATDQEALNSWLKVIALEGERTFKMDLDELKQLIRALAQWFTEGIYIITGNHDERLARATKGQVTLQMLLEDEPCACLMTLRTGRRRFGSQDDNRRLEAKGYAQDAYGKVYQPD